MDGSRLFAKHTKKKDLKEKKSFSVNDLVKFELSKSQYNRPRWQDNLDRGGNGQFAYGKIEEVSEEKIVVKFDIDGCIGSGIATFPNHKHSFYDSDQWSFDGYLQEISCECGSEAVYGASRFHSGWCEKAKIFAKLSF